MERPSTVDSRNRCQDRDHDWAEATDPYCLRPGEAAAALAGHPWRRFVAVGDSVAEGVGDAVEGYEDLSWVDRIVVALRLDRPDLAAHNLGRRDLLAAEVRASQLPAALAFRPDLALVAAGANDALRASYQPDQVDDELATIIGALRSAGADVITVGLFDVAQAPMFPARVKHLIGRRMLTLAHRTAALAERFGAIHVDVTDHPAGHEPDMHSRDGLHGNRRSHAILGAEAIRRVGTHLARTSRA